MLVEHFPLDRAGEAYRLLHDGKINGRTVITPHDLMGADQRRIPWRCGH